MENDSSLPNLKDMTLEELEAFISSLGKERYRARQIMACLYRKGASRTSAGKVIPRHADAVTAVKEEAPLFGEMTTLSKALRQYLAENTRLYSPLIAKTQVSRDTTKKILFQLHDGHCVESVLIPGKTHWTVCVSTQVGCRMGCRFCLTGRQGLIRNLTPAEITGQLTALQQETPEGPEIQNIVLMGMGEPLDNYDNVVKAIRILTSDHALGFSSRKVTLSTCGLSPIILKLGEDVCVNIAISLNAPDNDTRNELMPINRKYPLETVFDACRNYPMPGRRMITFEYILIRDVNDSINDARKLVKLLRGTRCKLNLIAFNEFPGSPFKTPTPETIAAFQTYLAEHHYTAILRASKGRDILAACGQLKGEWENSSRPYKL
ncbi:MAG: 23S rRNA (adenine(2503)-C(2))-methyltransferase RlmN [Syntrophobacterales bacterium]|jgi:23S rRNA (adenine2503-C2)-methyltransferase|nr:23S rRNA (adenine(2503)-C(2))-methyltransferase RlmN [Syntrophobacterales bacterium]